MKKVFLTTALAFVLLFSACGNPVGEGKLNVDDYSIWGAPSTVNIAREVTDYPYKKEARLNFSGARGERESAQIILTAENADIKEFWLETASVKDSAGNEVIAKTDFAVYNEFYVPARRTSAGTQGEGEYPDALVPANLAKKAGEMNVKKGNNGGLWVELSIPEEVAAGEYTAEFVLTVEKNTHVIPVSVKIYDVTIAPETHTRTLFVNRFYIYGYNELDSTADMAKNYYDFFLDYRVNLSTIPVDSLNPDAFVKMLKEYNENPKFNTFIIPTNITGELYLEPEKQGPILLKLLESIENEHDLTLLDKFIFYADDEPDQRVESCVQRMNEIAAFLQSIAEEVENDETGKYDVFISLSGENWKDKILNLDSVVTFTPTLNGVDPLLDKVSVWCPHFGHFSSEHELEKMLALRDEYNATLWWYGCEGLRAPLPSYHIDDYLISSRFVNWMAHKYGIEGNLYWSDASGGFSYEDPYFRGFDASSFKPWENEEFAPGSVTAPHMPAGEGFVVYPGLKYGQEGPIPSMRLMSIADGMEDYELLYALETEYKNLAEKYGVEDFDAQGTVSKLYDELIAKSVHMKYDSDLFASLRTRLLQTLENAGKPHEFLLADTKIGTNNAVLTMYANTEQYDLFVNGEKLIPDGNRFTYTLDFSKTGNVTIKTVNKNDASESYEMDYHIANRMSLLNDFNNPSVLDAVSFSEGSSAVLDDEFAVSITALKAEVGSRFTGNAITDARFAPYFKVSSDAWSGINFADVSKLRFSAYNPGLTSVQVSVQLTCGDEYVEVQKITLPGGMLDKKVRNYELSLALINYNKMDKIDGIRFVFENKKTGDVPVRYTVYLDDLTVEF